MKFIKRYIKRQKLIKEYKQDRAENLELAKEWIHVDLENWE